MTRTPVPLTTCSRCGRSVPGSRRLPRSKAHGGRGAPVPHRCPHDRPCLILATRRHHDALFCLECERVNTGPAENSRPVLSVQEGTLSLGTSSVDALHELSDEERRAARGFSGSD